MESDPNQNPQGQSNQPPQQGQGYPQYGQGYPPPPGYGPPGGQAYPPPPGYGPPGAPGYPPAGPGYPPPPGQGYPPPPGYGPPGQGYPPGGPGYPQPAPAPAPAGIGGLIQKWIRVTTRPGVASFDNELPTANWGDIWLSLIALGIVSAVFGFIAVQIYGAALNPLMNPSLKNLSPASRDIFQQAMGRSTGSAWASIVTVPIGFFIGMALLFVCAKIVGGTGSFLSQSYAAALYYVPIYGLAAVVQVVPVLGQIASALLGIYGLILGVMALAASQRLTIGRAIGAFAILIGAAVVLACALIIVIALIFAAVFRQTTP